MKTLYLITVAPKNQGDKPYRFVTNELSHISSEYSDFLVEKLDFDNVD